MEEEKFDFEAYKKERFCAMRGEVFKQKCSSSLIHFPQAEKSAHVKPALIQSRKTLKIRKAVLLHTALLLTKTESQATS